MKRYDIYVDYDGWVADEDEAGEFVKYEDVERESSEGRIMRDALRRISALDKNYKWESEAIADDALAAVSGRRE